MTHPPDPPDPSLRLPAPSVPPAERERVVEILTQQYAHDQLTEADLERRLDRVYQATTVAELKALVADLPVLVPDDSPRSAVAPAATAQRIRAFLSGQERKVTGVVPPDLELRARLGYVELDLTRATFAPGVTHIDVRAFMGYVQIRFPAGVRVESDGHAFAGFFSLKGAGEEQPGGAASVVQVTGRATFGFAECFVSPGAARRAAIAPPPRDNRRDGRR